MHACSVERGKPQQIDGTINGVGESHYIRLVGKGVYDIHERVSVR